MRRKEIVSQVVQDAGKKKKRHFTTTLNIEKVKPSKKKKKKQILYLILIHNPSFQFLIITLKAAPVLRDLVNG